MSVLAHFFVVVCGSLFHERLAHFFVDIYSLQKFQGVPGEPGNGLHQDSLDLPGPAVLEHPFEFIPLLQAGAGNALIGVDVRQLPTGVLGDEVGVVADLGAVGVELVRGVGGHPAVCRHFL